MPESNPTLRYLLGVNEEHSNEFINTQRARQIYRATHSTEIAVMKCMDGRVHLPFYTGTPPGIIQPWRNIGGRFNLGWPHYKETIQEWSEYCRSMARNSLVVSTYHFAKGFAGEDTEKVKHRGCAGFGYDTQAAMAASLELKNQFDRVFRNDGLYTIQVGVETDFQALIIHGNNGEVLDLSEYEYSDDNQLIADLHKLLPELPFDFSASSDVLRDLMVLVKGNINHVAEVKKRDDWTVADLEHSERVLALGRGFDWLHEPNLALIVGPYDVDLEEPISKAANIILGNIKEGRISKAEGVVLLTSAPYRGVGFKSRLAEEKANMLADFAYKVITEQVPDLVPYLSVAVSICDFDTRKIILIDRSYRSHSN